MYQIFCASFLLSYKNIFWVIPFNWLWNVCTKEVFIINKYTQLIKILFLKLLSLYLEKPYNIYSPFMQVNLQEEKYNKVKNGHVQVNIFNKHFNICLRLRRVKNDHKPFHLTTHWSLPQLSLWCPPKEGQILSRLT